MMLTNFFKNKCFNVLLLMSVSINPYYSMADQHSEFEWDYNNHPQNMVERYTIVFNELPLEGEIQNKIKSIYPCRSVVIRKSQLLQQGVDLDQGPTLDEIHAEEARKEAEIKAKKAAALAEAMAEEEAEDDAGEAEDEVVEEVAEAEEAPVEEEVAEEEAPAEEESSDDVDYSSMTVAELKALLKEAGKPVSGKKAELIERLQE